MTKSELLFWQLNQIKNCTSSCFVILCLSNQRGSQDIVSSFELRIQHLVRETSPADGDTSKDPVTLVLVHHKVWLNSSRNLVGVGDNTTDEVRLSLVQGGHQVIQLALEVGGDSLATLALLPVLVLWAKKLRID